MSAKWAVLPSDCKPISKRVAACWHPIRINPVFRLYPCSHVIPRVFRVSFTPCA
jgi:hypothetical protein